jgi:uncharacterized protein YvpB
MLNIPTGKLSCIVKAGAIVMRLAICFFGIMLLSARLVSAEIGWREGVVSRSQVPQPVVSRQLVILDVPHISQGADPLCVPTSSAMILAYYGERHDKWDLKKRAENYKPAAQRNVEFTYWVDMQHAVKALGRRWTIKNYAKTNSGFSRGLSDIRRSLRAGRPVMIDVHLGVGHTFVVAGFDDAKQLVYIRDPLLKKSQMRVLSYATLRDDWHNHRFATNRSAFFSR